MATRKPKHEPLSPEAIRESIRVAVAKKILSMTMDQATNVVAGCSELLPDADGDEFLHGFAERLIEAATSLQSYSYTGILRVEEILKTNCAPVPGKLPREVVDDISKELNDGVGKIHEPLSPEAIRESIRVFEAIPVKDLKLITTLLASLEKTIKEETS